ncbi:hypothetical protein H5410_002217, partial [Solanum commersonii]
LAHEFKCVTDERRRRVKQDILADFKGAFVKIHGGLANKVLPEDQLETMKHFPTFLEINNISRRSTSFNNSRSTLLKALESWRSLGEKNQENNKIVLTTIHQ